MKTYEEEKLKEEYTIKRSPSNLEEAKILDRRCKMPAYIFTYVYGVVGALLLGIGMCLAMGVIGGSTTIFLVIGIIVGLIGIVLVATNYPIFNKLLRSRKEKYSSQILLLLNKEE